jgi:serine phosphatase RsbU (regulator of sigma subunit)
LDVSANTEAFLYAVAEALTPSYKVLTVKQPAGPLKPLGSRGLSDPAAHLKRGPSQDEVAIPLKVGERAIGRLLLGPPVSGVDYSPADFALLDSLGQSLALSLRNAQLFEELAGQERLKRELEIACEVQMGLLPKTFTRLPGASLAAQCLPALEVGGDFFDFVQIDATRWGVLVGDVSGKGVPAALMMAVSLTLFRALAPGIPSPASTLGRLNKLIHRNRPSNKIFVAAIYFIYDARDGSVLVANAGHPPPVMDGQPVPIKGMPLGINPKMVYKETRFTLAPGSSLAVYSDGLEDIEDEAGRPMGPERVSALLRRLSLIEPEAALEGLQAELHTFAGRSAPPDDQTVAILRRNPAECAPPMPSPDSETHAGPRGADGKTQTRTTDGAATA